MEKGGNTVGELGPEAVLEALVKACESSNPRPQYFVTLPTYGMSLLRRIAPKRQLHAFLTWATDKGRRARLKAAWKGAPSAEAATDLPMQNSANYLVPVAVGVVLVILSPACGT